MIPIAYLREWSEHAPWPDLRQVEQDLIICRALCDLFSSEQLQGKIAFRGGTAIHKLLFAKPLRYSEDIDLVQTQAEPIGKTIDGVRDALSWLGKCDREHAAHTMHLVFRFTPEVDGSSPLKLKVEINTREHTNCHGLNTYPFEVNSGWHPGDPWKSSRAVIEEIRKTKIPGLLIGNPGVKWPSPGWRYSNGKLGSRTSRFQKRSHVLHDLLRSLREAHVIRINHLDDRGIGHDSLEPLHPFALQRARLFDEPIRKRGQPPRIQ